MKSSTPYLSSSPLDFDYLALPQVYTFVRWKLYTLNKISVKIGHMGTYR